MDSRSESILQFVHSDLDAIMRTAAQTPQPFVVVYGVRTLQAEEQAVHTGHSKTLHSRHLPSPSDHLSRAVDICALIDGKVSFAKGNEKQVFSQIATQVLDAADSLKIPVQWGGAEVGAWIPGKVSHFRDWGHFQLLESKYP